MQFIETVKNSLEEESERLFFIGNIISYYVMDSFHKKLKCCALSEKLTVEKHLYLLHFEVRKPVF